MKAYIVIRPDSDLQDYNFDGSFKTKACAMQCAMDPYFDMIADVYEIDFKNMKVNYLNQVEIV